jgi:hypothetical protein
MGKDEGEGRGRGKREREEGEGEGRREGGGWVEEGGTVLFKAVREGSNSFISFIQDSNFSNYKVRGRRERGGREEKGAGEGECVRKVG